MLVAATTGYQTRAFAEAGRRLGIEIVLATDRCHILEDPWGDHALPVRFDRPTDSFEQFEDLVFDGIVAVGDRPARVAAAIAEKLGLRFHPSRAVEAASDKHLARARFAAAGLVAPEHYRFEKTCPPDGARFYPCVLKPLGLSGSCGVVRANNDAEFAVAAASIRAILESPAIQQQQEERDRFIQVERYVDGLEFALEGLVTDGTLETLAIFDKPDPLEGPYFEETIYTTPSRYSPAVQDDLQSAAQQAVTALGLLHGPVHAEMRLAPEGVFVLEVAARPIGGLCSRALSFACGATLEEIILSHAVGEKGGDRGKALPAGVMMIPIPKSGVFQASTGLEEAKAVPDICDIVITAKAGQTLNMLPQGSSYLGFIFARGGNAELALRQSHERLSFAIQVALPISR